MSRSVVAAMSAYTLEHRESRVKLNQNESPFDVPREFKEAALAFALERGWNIYPDFESAALREAVAAAMGLTVDEILVGNGSNELLAASISTFVGPGTPVVVPRPSFALYEKMVSVAGGLAIPIEFDPSSGFLPVDDMLRAAAAHEGAVIIVCSPNNPTGGVLPSGGLDALLASGALVLFDRAYCDFEREPVTPGEPQPNLVTFRTFSKAFGLAAMRIGWLSSTAENCREIRKVKLPYSLNVVSEAVAAFAIRHPQYRDRNVAQIVEERERMLAAMNAIDGVTTFPTSANFITFRVSGAKALFDRLLQRGVLIRDVSSYARLDDCLRVSVGNRADNDAFLAALKEAL